MATRRVALTTKSPSGMPKRPFRSRGSRACLRLSVRSLGHRHAPPVPARTHRMHPHEARLTLGRVLHCRDSIGRLQDPTGGALCGPGPDRAAQALLAGRAAHVGHAVLLARHAMSHAVTLMVSHGTGYTHNYRYTSRVLYADAARWRRRCSYHLPRTWLVVSARSAVRHVAAIIHSYVSLS